MATRVTEESFIRRLGTLSSRIISVRAEGVDAEIVRALEGLVVDLGTDRASFYQFDTASRAVVSQSQWARPGIELDVSNAVRELPWYRARILAGETIAVSTLDELPPEASAERRFAERVGLKSNLTIPVSVAGRLVSVIATGSFAAPRGWPVEVVERVRIVGEILAGAVDRRNRDVELKRSLEEVRVLRDQLAAENDLLRQELSSSHDFQEIVGESPALKRTLARLAQVAPTDSTVLLLGETGTGKELLARAVHELCRDQARNRRPGRVRLGDCRHGHG